MASRALAISKRSTRAAQLGLYTTASAGSSSSVVRQARQPRTSEVCSRPHSRTSAHNAKVREGSAAG
jgi:hypothetical protein